jgi:hypothetical protein
MVRRLSPTELLIAALLIAAMVWADIAIGPTAIERWLVLKDGDPHPVRSGMRDAGAGRMPWFDRGREGEGT